MKHAVTLCCTTQTSLRSLWRPGHFTLRPCHRRRRSESNHSSNLTSLGCGLLQPEATQRPAHTLHIRHASPPNVCVVMRRYNSGSYPEVAGRTDQWTLDRRQMSTSNAGSRRRSRQPLGILVELESTDSSRDEDASVRYKRAATTAFSPHPLNSSTPQVRPRPDATYPRPEMCSGV